MKLTCDAVSTLQALLGVMITLFETQTQEDLSSPRKLHDGETFDFIIAGGGTAGCVVANRLTEIEDWTVLVLEAGGEEPFESKIPAWGENLKRSSLDWQYWTEPQNTSCGGNPCFWPRGKVLGGSSSINDMIFNRGNRYDYDSWAELGSTGWDYVNGVLPYFKKLENNLDPQIAQDTTYHSVGGYQSVGRFPHIDKNIPTILKGYEEAGYEEVDFNGPKVLGYMLLQASQFKGERRSTNRAYLDPIRQSRPNIKVITNVRVTRILTDTHSKAAYGVEYVGEKDRNIYGKVYAKKEVIVSAGSINSPQLLMLSGIGPADTLQDLDIPVVQDLRVGYNLHDHVGAFAVSYFVTNSARPNNEDIFKDAILYAKDKTGPWSGIGCLSVTAYTNTKYADKSIDFPDVQFSTIPSLSKNKDSKFCKVNFNVPWCYYNRITFMPSVLRPLSRGYLTIVSKDPFVRPLIYPNSFYKYRDMEVIVEGLKAVVKLSETKVFKKNGFTLDKTPPPKCSHLEFNTDDYWACAATESTHTNFHPVGTCKMGSSYDPDSVVDPQLRVYGVSNLRVIDSSIMPIVTSGNTNAPSIMIGEKGADLVKESYGMKDKS